MDRLIRESEDTSYETVFSQRLQQLDKMISEVRYQLDVLSALSPDRGTT